jgi:hypothetical protein
MNEIFKKFGISISPTTDDRINQFYTKKGKNWEKFLKNYIVTKQGKKIGIITKFFKGHWGYHSVQASSSSWRTMEEALLELLKTTDIAKKLFIDSKLSGNVITRIFDISIISNDLTNPNEELLLLGHVSYTIPGFRETDLRTNGRVIGDKTKAMWMFIDLTNRKMFMPNGKEFEAINKETFLKNVKEQIAEILSMRPNAT